MEDFVIAIFVLFGVLQIILLAKIWMMTNHVKSILDILNNKDNREIKLPEYAKVKGKTGKIKVLRMENGKVLCSSNGEEIAFSLDELEFETPS